VSWICRWQFLLNCCWVAFLIEAALARSALASDFRFDQDTFSFENKTVFEYKEGRPIGSKSSGEKNQSPSYTRRCFVMSRAAMQFHKFARFDPDAAPLDDKELARRVRVVMRKRPWHQALLREQRIVFPGYENLRAMSKARAKVLKENIGLGWPSYFRLSNGRMVFHQGNKYQERTQAKIDAALARGDLFVTYLSSYPWYTINHSVLIYARKPARPGSKIDHYLVYDPNHADAPRELKWSSAQRLFNYQKDEEFVGGFTRVYQVYGKPWQ
jgi:hypothetical protein